MGAVIYVLNLSLMSHRGNWGSCQFDFSSGFALWDKFLHTPIGGERRIKVCLPSTVWILHASPEGHGSGECFNRVVLGSTCSVAARSEYAWWCSRKGMKKKKEHYFFFFKKVLNDLPALLLTLHWDAAVTFKGASWTPTWVKLWLKRESGRERFAPLV